MLILANTLNFNGGTTFILRMAKESLARGCKLSVLVLTYHYDAKLLNSIEEVADVFFLKEFVPSILATGTQSDIFMPYKKRRLHEVVNAHTAHTDHIHVMGIFGLLFVAVYIKRFKVELNVSAGIYHQNEFMFQGVKGYLVEISNQLFKSLPYSNIIFFNENCQKSYAQFFGVDYTHSPLLPVGIELPKVNLDEVKHDGYRMVSIGNLYPFKTYNRHMISIMPDLLKMNSEVSYEIYGEGESEECLKELVRQLGIEHAVSFKGRIQYEDMNKVLKGAFLFVGSGTAIIEAAALGIPSIIGIESSQEPVTYGFFSSAEGFSYHEEVHGKPKYAIRDIVEGILGDSNAWKKESALCRKKAEEFGMSRTFEGFQSIAGKERGWIVSKTTLLEVRLLFSFLYLAFKHKFGINRSFASRRNEGSMK